MRQKNIVGDIIPISKDEWIVCTDNKGGCFTVNKKTQIQAIAYILSKQLELEQMLRKRK